MDECRSCKAKIRWAKTATGKAIPLDAEPVADGNMVLADGVAMVCTNPEIMPTSPRYKTHFATCPNASKHRTKGKQ